jgi:hypothetical protein
MPTSAGEEGAINLQFPRWIGVVCDDYERQREFYRSVLGLKRSMKTTIGSTMSSDRIEHSSYFVDRRIRNTIMRDTRLGSWSMTLRWHTASS